jgi:fatty acid desaturase
LPGCHAALKIAALDQCRIMVTDDDGRREKSFEGWRLLGVLGIVVVVIALVAAAVDWWVLGPLLERI